MPRHSTAPPAADLVVVALDEQARSSGSQPVDLQRCSALAEAVLRACNITAGELGLRFVDRDEMTRLNLAHMGSHRPTDVLSFPIDGAVASGAAPAGAAMTTAGSEIGSLLGDVVVCPAYAAAAAAAHAGENHDGSLADELALLVVHGVLHVLGWDHANTGDAARMQAREQELLARLHRS